MLFRLTPKQLGKPRKCLLPFLRAPNDPVRKSSREKLNSSSKGSNTSSYLKAGKVLWGAIGSVEARWGRHFVLQSSSKLSLDEAEAAPSGSDSVPS
jgi:hypothetical protein